MIYLMSDLHGQYEKYRKMKHYWKVFEDEKLTASQAGVYICLCKHQGKNEDGFPSHKTIARETHLSLSTVKQAINALADKKYMQHSRR